MGYPEGSRGASWSTVCALRVHALLAPLDPRASSALSLLLSSCPPAPSWEALSGGCPSGGSAPPTPVYPNARARGGPIGRIIGPILVSGPGGPESRIIGPILVFRVHVHIRHPQDDPLRPPLDPSWRPPDRGETSRRSGVCIDGAVHPLKGRYPYPQGHCALHSLSTLTPTPLLRTPCTGLCS